MSAKPFLLDPSYEGFIPGTSELKFSTLDTYNSWGCYFGSIGLGFFGGGGVCLLAVSMLMLLFPMPTDAPAPPANLPQIMLIVAALGVMSLLIGIYFITVIRQTFRGQRAYNQLKAQGQIIDGQLVSAKPEVRNTRFSSYFYLAVTYSFLTPEGRRLTKKQAASRPDLKGASLPTAGTPVKVLYANDSAMVML